MDKGKSRLVLYIALSYLGQGFAQHFCLLSQPLDNFFLHVCRWNAADVASYMALLMVPWTLKPAFGFLVDMFPLPGSSKKSYLMGAFLLAAVCYAGAAFATRVNVCSTALLVLSSAALACVSATLLGLVVQRFRGDSVSYIIAWQNFMYYIALICAGLLAGNLCQFLQPIDALKKAAMLSSLACGLTALVTYFLVEELPTRRRPIIFFTARLKNLSTNKTFLLAALFVFCWSFSPGFGTPLYFHYTNVLHLKQSVIGLANSINSIGMVVGSLLYALLRRFMPAAQIQFSLIAAIATTLLFIAVTPDTVFAVEFFHGVTNMLGALTASAIIAHVSPRALETLASAFLIGVYNLGTQVGAVVGANLYTHVFSSNLSPLLVVSGLTTAGCCFLALQLDRSDVRNFPVSLPNDLVVLESSSTASGG